MTSLITDTDVIATPGLSAIPGAAGMVGACAGFTGGIWPGLRRPHPTYFAALWAALGAIIAHLALVWIAALVTGAGPAKAGAAVGAIVTGWTTLVIAAAAFVAAWATVAVRRTRARPPRWPWEQDSGA